MRRISRQLSEPYLTELPARRFFDPLAAAVIEQRRDLLWSRENAPARGAVAAGSVAFARGPVSLGYGLFAPARDLAAAWKPLTNLVR